MFIMSILFQVLKLYAWELLFKEKILSIRKTEMKILWKASIIGIGFTFSWTVAPYIVSHYLYMCMMNSSSSYEIYENCWVRLLSNYNIKYIYVPSTHA